MPVLPPAPAYDEQRRGIVDSRTHSFRPNINAHATPAPVDVRAAEAGTNATGPSPAFLKAFPNRPGALDRAAEAQQVTAVPANKSIANAPAIQSALDRAAGVGQNPSAGVTTAPSNFGSGSVRFAKANETLPPATVSADGVTRDVFDEKAARQALYENYPEIFQDGTAQNKAFVEHAQKHGFQDAHDNIGKVLAPTYANQSVGPAQTRGDLLTPGTADARMAEASTAKNMPPTGLIDPNSVLGKVTNIASNIGNAPSAIGQGVKDLAKGALGAVGVTPAGISKVGNTVRGWADTAANVLKPLDNAVSGFFKSSENPTSGQSQSPLPASNFTNPSQPPVTPTPPVATNPTAPDPAEEARKRLAANNQSNGSGY